MRVTLATRQWIFLPLLLQLPQGSSFVQPSIGHSVGQALHPLRQEPFFRTGGVEKIYRQVHRSAAFQACPNNEASSPEESTLQRDQHALSKMYHGTSVLYCGQVVLAIKRHGLTLENLNFVGGPMMAAGILYLLGNSASKEYLGFDTCKRLNGLLFLYAIICLGIFPLVPKVQEPNAMLWLFSSVSMLVLATKGYLSGLCADGNKSFLPETRRLFKAAAQLTMSRPLNGLTDRTFIRLVTVAIRKGVFVGGVLKELFFGGGGARLQIVPKLSQLAKLTLLGGSLVASISVEDNEVARNMTVGPINMMALYVFSVMSAFTLTKASNPLELADGLLLSISAFCSAAEVFHQTKRNSSANENCD